MLKSGILSLVFLLSAAPAFAQGMMMQPGDEPGAGGPPPQYDRHAMMGPSSGGMQTGAQGSAQGGAMMQPGDQPGTGPATQTQRHDMLGPSPAQGGPQHGGGMMQPGDQIATGSPTQTDRHAMLGPGGQGTNMQNGMMHPPLPGIPGMVSSVSANSFTMNIPWGREHATTTVTVNISATTKFLSGSTTASLASLTSGSKVIVQGKIATSTKSIAAERVMLIPAMNEDHGQGQGGGILHRIKTILFGHTNTVSSQESGNQNPAAVGESDGVLSSLFHALFGWL